MRVTTDDPVYQVTNRWLGPWTGHPFPVAVTYGSIGIGLLTYGLLLVIESFVGIHGGTILNLVDLAAALAVGYFIGEKISHDVTGRSVLGTFLAETNGKFRATTDGEHAVLRPDLVRRVKIEKVTE
jgi:hypothetical protein